MATTKYTPRPLNIPQGQAPGSSAEVIRRARGTNPLVQALMQPHPVQRGGGGGRGQTRPQIGVTVDAAGEKRREQARKDAATLQENAARLSREAEVDRREYTELQDEQSRKAKFKQMEATTMMGNLSSIQAARMNQINQAENRLNVNRARIVAGESSALAAGEALGLKPLELLKQYDEEGHAQRRIWTNDLFSDVEGAQTAIMEYWETSTRPSTMSMEGGEEEFPAERPELPPRAMDYAFNDFLGDVQRNLMFADQAGQLKRRDVAQGMMRSTVTGQKFKEEGLQKFAMALRANGMQDKVVIQRKSEKLLRSLSDVVKDAILRKEPVDQAEVNKLIAQANQIPEFVSIIEQTLNGQTPAFRKDANPAHVGALIYGNTQLLARSLTDLRGTDVEERLRPQGRIWQDPLTPEKILDKMEEIIFAAQGNIEALEADPLASQFVGHARGTLNLLENYRSRGEAVLKALQLDPSGRSLPEKYLEDLEGTTDDLLRVLGIFDNKTLPHYQLLDGTNSLSPKARAILRASPPEPRRQAQSTESPGTLQTQSLAGEDDEDAAMRRGFQP